MPIQEKFIPSLPPKVALENYDLTTGKITSPGFLIGKENKTELNIGDKEYILASELGEGGDGKAYLIQEKTSGALKVLKIMGMRPDEETLREEMKGERPPQLIQEFKIAVAAGKAKPKDLVIIPDAPNRDGIVYANYGYVTPLASGREMRALLRSEQKAVEPMFPFQLAEMLYKSAAAVDELHARKVLHGDLKPENIFMDFASGQATLLDFGSSHPLNAQGRLITPGAFGGTHDYLAPEINGRWEGPAHLKGPSTASDIYALGLVFGELCGYCRQLDKAPEDPAAFTAKTFLSDNEEFKNFYERMIHPDPTKRPAMWEILEITKRVYDFNFNLTHEALGFLDVKTFRQATEAQKQEFLAALGNVNRVVLINNQETPGEELTGVELFQLKEELRKKLGNCISSSVYTVANAKEMAELPEYLQKKENSHRPTRPLRSHFYFDLASNPPPPNAVFQGKGLYRIPLKEGASLYYPTVMKHLMTRDKVLPAELDGCLVTLNNARISLMQKYKLTAELLEPHNAAKLSPTQLIVARRIETLNGAILQIKKGEVSNRGLLVELLKDTAKKMYPTGIIDIVLGLRSSTQKDLENFAQKREKFSEKIKQAKKLKASSLSDAQLRGHKETQRTVEIKDKAKHDTHFPADEEKFSLFHHDAKLPEKEKKLHHEDSDGDEKKPPEENPQEIVPPPKLG